MSGWIFLAIGAVGALVDFAIGLGWRRRAADRGVPGAPPPAEPAEPLGQVGWILMMAAPIFLLVFAAIAFGLVPVGGVDPIAFN